MAFALAIADLDQPTSLLVPKLAILPELPVLKAPYGYVDAAGLINGRQDLFVKCLGAAGHGWAEHNTDQQAGSQPYGGGDPRPASATGGDRFTDGLVKARRVVARADRHLGGAGQLLAEATA